MTIFSFDKLNLLIYSMKVGYVRLTFSFLVWNNELFVIYTLYGLFSD